MATGTRTPLCIANRRRETAPTYNKEKSMNQSSISNPQSAIIKVLVVDDSSFMRKSLTYILESDLSIKVIGVAEDGVEAIQKVKELHPDVVLLDIMMPKMDGFMALQHIMHESPTPILMVSALMRKDQSIAIKSLEYGAIDFIAKPSGQISYDIDKIRDEIIAKVKTVAKVDVKKLVLPSFDKIIQKKCIQKIQKRIVVIGASTGGPRAVVTVLSALPRNIPAAILVVQHIVPEFVPSFADRLRWESVLEVTVAEEGETLDPGRVLVAPSRHTKIVKDGGQKRISIDDRCLYDFNAYAVDYAMESAAGAYGDEALGVLLTGMGSDGAKGMKGIKNSGGSTIAEDPSTCIVFGMPRAAIELGCVDRVVPLPEIAQAIMEMI